MKNDLVSIVFPVYNNSAFLEDAICSVVNQTFSNWELLIIDDCSSDNSVDICLKLAESNERIRVFLNENNMGAGYSRNVGLKNARGRFIAFMDSDDLWSDSKLQVQFDFMKSDKLAISYTSYDFIDECGVRLKGIVSVSGSVDLVGYLKTTEIGTSTSMIDRYQVKFVFSLARTRQDTMFWISALSDGLRAYAIPDVLCHYRSRPGQISANKLKMLYRTFVVYMGVHNLPVRVRFYCYLHYIFNAIKKRIVVR